MRREFHVRFREGGGVRFPSATRLVLLSRMQQLAEHSLRELRGLLEPLGLRLNEEKSRIVHARDGFDFLGFHVRWVASDRTGRMFPLWRPRRAAVQRVKERLKTRAKAVSLSEDASVMITELNRSLRGWAVYYRVSNASTDFKKVDRFARDQVRIWLCRKYRERSRGRERWPSLWLYHRLGLHCLVSDVRSGARPPPNAPGEARRRAVCGKTARTVR